MLTPNGLLKFRSLGDACEEAIKVSRESEAKYSAVIKSNGEFYVEDTYPLVRVWEELIAEYEDGILKPQI